MTPQTIISLIGLLLSVSATVFLAGRTWGKLEGHEARLQKLEAGRDDHAGSIARLEGAVESLGRTLDGFREDMRDMTKELRRHIEITANRP